MSKWILYYDSRYINDTVRELLKLAKEIPDIEIVDTAGLSEQQLKDIYSNILALISVFTGIKLRGRVRTHKAGTIFFGSGVLVRVEKDPRRGGIWIGKDAVEILKRGIQ